MYVIGTAGHVDHGKCALVEAIAGIANAEPGEAEWSLDVLESLFDFCFVQPTLLQKKREALDNKLKEAGMPPMKGGDK